MTGEGKSNTTLLLASLFLGGLAGLLVNAYVAPEHSLRIALTGIVDFLGSDLFVGLLKLIIAPLIAASIVAAIGTLNSLGSLGRIGLRLMAFYAVTTTLAVLVGLACTLVIRPGYRTAALELREAREAELSVLRAEYDADGQRGAHSANPRSFEQYIFEHETQHQASANRQLWSRVEATRDTGIWTLIRTQLIAPMLVNPFHALSQNPPNSLGIIFFAMLFGVAALTLPAAERAKVFELAAILNDAIMKITSWIMATAPVALAALACSVMVKHGLTALSALLAFTLTVLIGIFLHSVLLLLLVRFLGKRSIPEFLLGIREIWLIAFSTASSAATLPVTIRVLKEHLHVSERVANFSLPLGATLNMDGTALYEAVALLFLVQVYGGLADTPATFTIATILIVVVMAIVTSAGVAAVPGASLVAITLIAASIGLPIYYLPLIYAVDRILDMFRTATNVMGDAVAAVVVERWSERSTDLSRP
ncbi:MAG: dicarboxylate/amino acid:cation symporter [Candidatus Hydrogenedentes bacterium]|nr:dicarboxylate/amino acid:cation symporter [Candidatus Hydrogenedentota bacterium]